MVVPDAVPFPGVFHSQNLTKRGIPSLIVVRGAVFQALVVHAGRVCVRFDCRGQEVCDSGIGMRVLHRQDALIAPKARAPPPALVLARGAKILRPQPSLGGWYRWGWRGRESGGPRGRRRGRGRKSRWRRRGSRWRFGRRVGRARRQGWRRTGRWRGWRTWARGRRGRSKGAAARVPLARVGAARPRGLELAPVPYGTPVFPPMDLSNGAVARVSANHAARWIGLAFLIVAVIGASPSEVAAIASSVGDPIVLIVVRVGRGVEAGLELARRSQGCNSARVKHRVPLAKRVNGGHPADYGADGIGVLAELRATRVPAAQAGAVLFVKVGFPSIVVARFRRGARLPAG